MTEATRHDLLVVGGGPGGSAAAYWAARAGLDVVVVEKKTFPRDKTCGDGLTPRAVTQLAAMGLEDRIAGSHHRHDGLRTIAHGRTLELPWPDHPEHPSYGYVVRRRDLDTMVAEHAQAAGAKVLQGTEATRPILESGLLRGAEVRDVASDATSEIRASWVIIADGANSRFGRALGCSRERSWPQGMAIRTYFESPLSTDPWIESALDVRDRQGNSLPGYGWIFPLGDGTINVGIGLLSTFRDYKSVNTSHLMEEWAHAVPEHWGIDPTAPLQDATGGRLPMAGSVDPKLGPNWVVIGDAAGSINPFNGEGIDYAYETGRKAAELIAAAHAADDGLILNGYERWLDDEYGLYFKVARIFAKVIGNPRLIAELTRAGMQSRPLMEWALRIMANLLRPDEVGPAEAAYRAIAAIVKVTPE
ncbi:MAG: geranylgeranyl reductase family protein [Acidimicrobiales bacterium]